MIVFWSSTTLRIWGGPPLPCGCNLVYFFSFCLVCHNLIQNIFWVFQNEETRLHPQGKGGPPQIRSKLVDTMIQTIRDWVTWSTSLRSLVRFELRWSKNDHFLGPWNRFSTSRSAFVLGYFLAKIITFWVREIAWALREVRSFWVTFWRK